MVFARKTFHVAMTALALLAMAGASAFAQTKVRTETIRPPGAQAPQPPAEKPGADAQAKPSPKPTPPPRAPRRPKSSPTCRACRSRSRACASAFSPPPKAAN